MTHREDLTYKKDIYLAIISHRRPHNVSLMHEKTGGNATWYVADDQDLKEYTTEVTKSGIESEVKVTGSLCKSRNQALKDAWEKNLTCVMIDDDMRRIKLVSLLGTEQTKFAADVTFAEAVEVMRRRLEETKILKLAGAAPTSNVFYYNPAKPTTTAGFIGGWFMMVKPNDLLFDEQFRTKEDYDYTLQHINRYGGVLRCNDVLAEFAHYDNKGGVVSYRTAQVEQESIKRLQKKWGTAIRVNKKRENEILLNIRA